MWVFRHRGVAEETKTPAEAEGVRTEEGPPRRSQRRAGPYEGHLTTTQDDTSTTGGTTSGASGDGRVEAE